MKILRASCVGEVNAFFVIEIINKHIVKAFLSVDEIPLNFLLALFVVEEVVFGALLKHVVIK